MEKSSRRQEAYHALSILGARDPILDILESLAKEHDAIVLEASPTDPHLTEKLIRAKTIRFLHTVFSREIK